MKKLLVVVLSLYSAGLFILLSLHLQNDTNERAVILMGFTLFILWVIVGGAMQLRYLKRNYEKLSSTKEHPVISFALFATLLACAEEAIATCITNLAPLFGGALGQSYITASTNYFHIIFYHSVIVFVPMFFMLGYLLKKYSISPFAAFLLFGGVGVLGEFTLSGSTVFINTPFWILVYGLMVYIPAHIFVHSERKKISPFLYILFIPLIAFSAITTFWLPVLLDNTATHFIDN
jgi:hypothetical protein